MSRLDRQRAASRAIQKIQGEIVEDAVRFVALKSSRYFCPGMARAVEVLLEAKAHLLEVTAWVERSNPEEAPPPMPLEVAGFVSGLPRIRAEPDPSDLAAEIAARKAEREVEVEKVVNEHKAFVEDVYAQRGFAGHIPPSPQVQEVVVRVIVNVIRETGQS